MTSFPTHSLIIPVHNGEQLIEEALASALPQLGAADEVLVVDNGSTDATIEVVSSLGDRRITVLHAERRGPAAARNVGLAAARGTFVSFLDHDDLWPPGRLSGLAAALQANPAADAAAGRLTLRFDGVVPETRLAAMAGSNSDTLSLCTILFRCTALATVGALDETLLQGEDLDYLVRLRSRGLRVVRCDLDALVYRQHAGNASRNRDSARTGNLGVLRRNIARQRGRSDPLA